MSAPPSENPGYAAEAWHIHEKGGKNFLASLIPHKSQNMNFCGVSIVFLQKYYFVARHGRNYIHTITSQSGE